MHCFTQQGSLISNLLEISIGLRNGLALIWRQAILVKFISQNDKKPMLLGE